ncbi:MAG: signal peptidase II [Methylocystis sp.]|nr:signal peptidase II [Methylocystis sp.]MBI3275371.1 signal peptidase II [Methylocystis sp.]
MTSASVLRGPRVCGLVALVAALALDQGHKFWMLQLFDISAHQPIRVAPFLDIVLSWNFGISYSLFAARGELARLVLLAVQLAIIAGIFLCLWRAQRRLTAVGLGLIAGGALGNVSDRLAHGAVADFFFFHTSLPVGPLANYVFNLADAAIFVGVALLCWQSFATRPRAPEPPDAA